MLITQMRRIGLWVLLIGFLAGCGLFAPILPDQLTGLFADEGAVGLARFAPIQVDPDAEDSAGPHFAVVGDVDGDGLLDIATAWNESKPIQVHFQRRDAAGAPTFETLTLAGDFPITIVSGLAVEDMDGDGSNDVVVLVKDSGVFAQCRDTGATLDAEDAPAGMIIIYFSPGDPALLNSPLAWEDVELSQSMTAGAPPADPTKPEVGGYTDMALADVDGVNGPDIIVAWNANDCEGGGNRVDYFANPGSGTARQTSAWAAINVEIDAPAVKSLATADIDRDGDTDIVVTYPTARGASVRWMRNPLIDVPDPFHQSDGTWQRGSVGRLAPGADIVKAGDVDGDGITDLVVRSTVGKLIVWYKGPENPTTAPIRSVPWQVFTVAEFATREPVALSLGDIDNDGQLEIMASVQSALLWFDVFPGRSVFEQWRENVLVDDSPEVPAVTDPNVDRTEISEPSTFINSVTAVDLDGDGQVDILGTLDRNGQSGVANDAVIWYRNRGF